MRVARMLAPLILLAAMPAEAPAGALTGIEAFTSTVLQKDQSSFSGIGFRLLVHPPQLAQGFSIVPSIEYWRNKSTIKTFGIESSRKDATLGTYFRYDMPREGWHPYLGAGFAVHFISNEVDAPSLGLRDASDALIKGGVTGMLGVSFGLAGRVANLVDLQYHHVPDHSQVKINWGLSVAF